MDLSAHLSVAEFLATSHRALVDEQARTWAANPSLWLAARALGETVFEPAREVLGVPLHVTSGFRCFSLNQAVGGRPNSRHVLALAVDVVPVGMPLGDAFKAIVAEVRGRRLPHVDEAILECGAWIHLQAAAKGEPRRLCLVTADGAHFEAAA
jgi:zinc D-Ala-D-Ala carboxypeptidase